MHIKEYLEKRRKKKFKKKYRVGLCLSGGGTRGFAHLGAFKAFEEAGIEFDMVAGTSAGSLFGALYATKMKYADMLTLASGVKNSDFRNAKLKFLPSKMDNLNQLIKSIFPVRRIEELKIPFFAVSVDLKTGEEIHFKEGELAPILSGSCAIPGVYYPVKYKNMTLIDGGVKNNIPADVLRDNGCDFVVTIDCNCTRGRGTKSENFFTQFMASVGIMNVNNSNKGKALSDIVICPNMEKFASMKVKDRIEMINEGYRATKEMMPYIENLFSGRFKKRK